MKLTKLMLATAVAATAITSAPAAAVEVVFAQIGLIGSGTNFRWDRSGTSDDAVFYTTAGASSTQAGNTAVLFSLVGAATPLAVVGNMLLSGSTTDDALGVTTGEFVQNVDSFTFNITATSAFTYNSVSIAAGQSLLQGSVSNARITGNIGGTTGSLVGSTLGGATITYTSPLFTFAPQTNYGFSLGLGGVNAAFASGANNRALNDFRSTISGTYQSDPAPTFVAVPEPTTWAMMIVGMGLVGFARRRRSTVVAA